MKRKLLWAGFLLSLLIFLSNACGRSSDEKPQDFGDTLVVAVSDTTDDNQQYQWAMELSGYLGRPTRIVVDDNLKSNIEKLSRGEYQLVARRIPVTSDLRNEVLFSESVAQDRQVLVQRGASDTTSQYVRNQLELSGKKIHVASASPAIQRLRNMEQEIADSLVIIETEVGNCQRLIEMVSDGRADYAVCDRRLAEPLLDSFPNIDIELNITFNQMQSWAVNKDSSFLMEKINDFLKSRLSK